MNIALYLGLGGLLHSAAEKTGLGHESLIVESAVAAIVATAPFLKKLIVGEPHVDAAELTATVMSPPKLTCRVQRAIRDPKPAIDFVYSHYSGLAGFYMIEPLIKKDVMRAHFAKNFGSIVVVVDGNGQIVGVAEIYEISPEEMTKFRANIIGEPDLSGPAEGATNSWPLYIAFTAPRGKHKDPNATPFRLVLKGLLHNLRTVYLRQCESREIFALAVCDPGRDALQLISFEPDRDAAFRDKKHEFYHLNITHAKIDEISARLNLHTAGKVVAA